MYESSSPYSVNPAISAAPKRDSDISEARITELRALPYADYLQTPEWRKRRNRALERGHHRCSRCESKRELQVHHLSYERLGAEWDTDLEVLCRPCHEGHHFEESRRQHLGVYVKLVSDSIRVKGFTTFADLSADVREQCAKLSIPCDIRRISAALETMTTARLPLPSIRKIHEHLPWTGEPIGREEAAEILKTLKIQVPFKEIPRVKRTTQAAVDRAKAMKMIAQEMKDSIERCEALESTP